jgi:hypothetical protein
MKAFFLFTLGCLSLALAQTNQSFYTAIDPTNCVPLSSSEWQTEPTIDYFVQECPSLAGYRLFVKAGDARSWLELSYAEQTFPFAPWDLGDVIQGFFPYIKGNLAEWRYTITGDEASPEFSPYALIYRMAFQDMNDEAKEHEQLMVLRLTNQKACFLGATSTNEEARLLADRLELNCFD